MQFFPLFFRFAGRKILVVGGGKVAERKVRMLLESGANVILVAPDASDYLANLAKDKIITWNKRKYIPGEAGDYAMVIATTNNAQVNHQIYADAAVAHIPLNVVDQPDLCSVIFPAIVRRGDMVVAVASDGKAPFLTKSFKEELERQIPQSLGKKTALAGVFRKWVMENDCSEAVKNLLYSKFLENVDLFLDIWQMENPPCDLWEKWREEALEN